MERTGWPKAMFHAETGEERVFKSEDDVAEGFVTRDDFEGGKAAPAPRVESPNKGLAKANGLTKKAMQAELDEAGIEYDKSLGVDDLAAFYLDLSTEEEDADEDHEE